MFWCCVDRDGVGEACWICMCNISLCRLLSPVRVWCRIPSARVCSTHGGEVDEEASSALRSEACEEAGGGAETYAAEFYIRAPPCMGIRRFFGETPEGTPWQGTLSDLRRKQQSSKRGAALLKSRGVHRKKPAAAPGQPFVPYVPVHSIFKNSIIQKFNNSIIELS